MAKKNEEREIIVVSKNACMTLLKALDIEPKCHFCGHKINKKNFGGVYNKPNRVICNGYLCTAEFAVEDLTKKKRKWVFKDEATKQKKGANE